jgi:probable rRNA maturation factor
MIEIISQQNKHKVNRKRLKELLEKLVARYGLQDPEIALVFVDNKMIRDLNLKFRKKDAATDVLSFPLKEKSRDGKFYLGDIIISVPYAYEQSASRGQTLDEELDFLTLHGFLHLLGYTHGGGIEEEQEKAKACLAGSKTWK